MLESGRDMVRGRHTSFVEDSFVFDLVKKRRTRQIRVVQWGIACALASASQPVSDIFNCLFLCYTTL